MTSPQIDNVSVYIPNETVELPDLNPVGKLGGREVTHIPASHSGSESEGVKSKNSKIANSIVCVMCLGLIIAGGVMQGTMNDACDNQRPDCNPTLRTAGMGMWIAGTSIIGLQCTIVGVALCCAGAIFCCTKDK